MLENAIGRVNDTQQTAAGMKQAFETGTGSASLAEVMIATQKADLSFRAMTEVRNKLVTAYQDIMNMPV
jgi:flagellar hook-basal body complex protein FliE